MFGRQRNLYNYLWQPFRSEELSRWFNVEDESVSFYMQEHSCMPYRYPFVEERCKGYLEDWNEGKTLSNGHYKRVTWILGYRFWRKEYLYYCPECVRSDRREYGETYWHMILQLPGVTVCPIHMVPLEKSHILLKGTKYELLPAEYNLPRQTLQKENISFEDLQIAQNSKWMMENGWNLDSRYFADRIGEGVSLSQHEKIEAVMSEFTLQQNVMNETLYWILLACEKGVSISSNADR